MDLREKSAFLLSDIEWNQLRSKSPDVYHEKIEEMYGQPVTLNQQIAEQQKALKVASSTSMEGSDTETIVAAVTDAVADFLKPIMHKLGIDPHSIIAGLPMEEQKAIAEYETGNPAAMQRARREHRPLIKAIGSTLREELAKRDERIAALEAECEALETRIDNILKAQSINSSRGIQ
jgi:hypothetical protein